MNSAPAAPNFNRRMPHRMMVVTAFLLVGFGVVVWRLHQVQVVQNELWRNRAEVMVKQKRVLPALRGAIYDINGELLAHDKIVHDLWIDAHQLKDLNDVRIRLAKLEKVPYSTIRSKPAKDVLAQYRQNVAALLAEGLVSEGEDVKKKTADIFKMITDERRSEFPLLKGIEEEEANVWRKRLDQSTMVAITLRPAVKRFYPCAERLTHVLGFANDELVKEPDEENPTRTRSKIVQTGREGIEAIMNNTLRGSDGFQWIERDRKGREIPAFRGESKQPQHGNEVWLTIDMHLQDTLENVIQQAFEFHRPRRIVAVLVEPQSGAILAMGSRPHFERDTMKGTMMNLAIGAEYEPGSVFKVVAFTGALDRKLTTLGDKLNCDPNNPALVKMRLQDHVSGTVTTEQAFEQSSNRGSYLLAKRLGEESYLDYAGRFGFGKKTGISLTGEIRGTVQARKNWDSLTFSRMAIGHAVTVTPLQMVMAVSAIANGGNLMKPQIIREIRDQSGGLLQQFEPQIVNRVCSEQTADLMRKAMVSVVSGAKGTGSRAAIDDISVGGKTGTSQRRREDGRGYEPGHYCVSFAGFAPAENPRLCAIIVVDDPRGDPADLMGGKLAAPIFAQLMKQSLNTMAVAHADESKNTPLVKGSVE